MNKKIGWIALVVIVALSITGTVFASSDGLIGKDRAKDIALQNVNGIVEEIELEREKGQLYYEVEIEQAKKDDIEVHVDAVSGQVIKVEADTKATKQTQTQTQVQPQAKSTPSTKTQQSNGISIEQAKKIALDKFEGTIVEIERDRDDGRLIYEIEIKTSQGEVELDIDALTGEILEIDYDDDYKTTKTKKQTQTNKQTSITLEQARQIALQAVDGKIDEIERDWDDGRLIYEIEMKTSRGEVEIEIDAHTGKIIEIEYDDD